MALKVLKVLGGQNIFDICVQEFGTLEELFVLLIDNDLSVNTKLISGQQLTVNKVNIGNENVKDFVVLGDITMNNAQGLKLPPLLSGDYNLDYNGDYF